MKGILVLAVLLIAVPAHFYSVDIDISSNITREIENLKKINQEIREREAIINDLSREKGGLITSIEILNNRIEINKKHIEIINDKLFELKERIARLSYEKDSISDRISEITESICRRMANIYKYGKHNLFESFIKSSDINEIVLFTVYNKYLMKYETELFSEFDESRILLVSREEELSREYAGRKEALHLKNLTLTKLNQDIKYKYLLIDRINNDIQQHKKYLGEIEETSREISKFIEELESINNQNPQQQETYLEDSVYYPREIDSDPIISEDNKNDNNCEIYQPEIRPGEQEPETISEPHEKPASEATEEIINEDPDIQSRLERMRQTQSRDFQKMKGRLIWPYGGEILLKYGKIYNNKHNTYYFHNGIDIQAPSGSPVKSVYYGQVVFDGWYKGYGNLIIIDHRRGYYTLYAHLDKILVKKGNMVEEGTLIGLSGDTGSIKGALLYFEIRRYNNTYNPREWLSRR